MQCLIVNGTSFHGVGTGAGDGERRLGYLCRGPRGSAPILAEKFNLKWNQRIENGEAHAYALRKAGLKV